MTTVLPMWTIYICKEGGYVAVQWVVSAGEEPRNAGDEIVSEHLQPLREVLAMKGLIPITRDDEKDDPTIVETWL
jgi:hypothetical protein